ncbi:hypothetical protein OBV_09020 [Oscillibacter valericigenes Sjm18-20]|nr:hypothetical protein OBV_09020 [Oscillibacter valericigenes Sjm18-20]
MPPVSPCVRLWTGRRERIPPAELDHPVGAVFGSFGSVFAITIFVQDKAVTSSPPVTPSRRAGRGAVLQGFARF